MLTITNGFTYIAFLMLLAGGLLALEKYMKWKIFNIVPPLVWIYIFNMFFCTIGLYNSDECSAAYSALKNNILYAMIFVMLLRCDFRKLGKLGPRMICIFMGCAITLGIGFFALFPLIVFITVQKHNDIGILFQGSGFTQVREHGAVVFTFFNFTVELRKGHDRYVEFFGYSLERAGDIRNFEFTGVRAP